MKTWITSLTVGVLSVVGLGMASGSAFADHGRYGPPRGHHHGNAGWRDNRWGYGYPAYRPPFYRPYYPPYRPVPVPVVPVVPGCGPDFGYGYGSPGFGLGISGPNFGLYLGR